MIRVNKIAHATYETPDLDKQTEYYTDIYGTDAGVQGEGHRLSRLHGRSSFHRLAARRAGKLRAALPSKFRLTPTSTHSRNRLLRTGSKPSARKIPSRRSPTWSRSPIPKGTTMQVFKRDAFSHQKFTHKGIVPFKLGHVAFHVTDVKHVHQILLRRARLPRIRLDGGFLLVPALQFRSSHHQPDGDWFEPALPHRLRAARLGPYA